MKNSYLILLAFIFAIIQISILPKLPFNFVFAKKSDSVYLSHANEQQDATNFCLNDKLSEVLFPTLYLLHQQ